MRLEQFDFSLPVGQIARQPSDCRDCAKLLVLHRATGQIRHHKLSDLPELLDQTYHLVANDSQVVPSTLEIPKGGGTEAVSFAYESETKEWSPLGMAQDVATPHRGQVWLNPSAQEATQALLEGNSYTALLECDGRVTYPRYLKHMRRAFPRGVPAFYNNVYAEKPGSVAPPSAGLNLTDEVLETLMDRGVGFSTLTLHVGHVTFRRPKVEHLEQHKMEGERYEISPTTAQALLRAKGSGQKLLAVGTTSTRTLEHIAHHDGGLRPEGHRGIADIFIRPGHEFRGIDGLLTGLHGPKTTLFMLVCAFGGYEAVMSAYAEAVERDYRWYTLGDSMLIL